MLFSGHYDFLFWLIVFRKSFLVILLESFLLLVLLWMIQWLSWCFSSHVFISVLVSVLTHCVHCSDYNDRRSWRWCFLVHSLTHTDIL
jgi:membrane protein YdbS with pleckstrin-like domain